MITRPRVILSLFPRKLLNAGMCSLSCLTELPFFFCYFFSKFYLLYLQLKLIQCRLLHYWPGVEPSYAVSALLV